jgi:hydrophobic/amphiphilic exporter-1 (mainly G- bacteria), HAE1 family
MNLTRMALGNPVAVVVGALLVLLFGTLSLLRLPIQMTPDVEYPQIAIVTSWRAAAPEEVESEILEQQEDVLRGLPGLTQLESTASQGQASISLFFKTGTDMQRALLEVINRMNQVPIYPADALEPVIINGGNTFGNAIAWFALRPLPDNPRDIASYQDFVDEVIRARIERIPGISKSDSYGGRQREVRITFDPYLAAAYGIDVPNLVRATGGNVDSSAGFNDIGRRQYTVRYAGRYDATDMGDMVLTWRDGQPIHLSDIATVDVTMVDAFGTLNLNGGPAIAFNAQPEQGINVLDAMEEIKAVMAELAAGPIAAEGLYVEQVYDETTYITDSITMLRNNLLLGITLAIGILWWFLRRFRATLVVAVAIPVSLFVTFIMLMAAGRTLNIISLAGLAFSVGMVLDAAIVVLENIVRLREEGKSVEEAASEGPQQVYGALIASTATTVAIFLPVVFLEDTAGQLFADLAIAISVAVVASLVIATTIIPAAATTVLRRAAVNDDPHSHWWDGATDWIMRTTDQPKRRWVLIAALTMIPIMIAVALKPQADYLPTGKRNLIFGFMLPPPGLSVETATAEIADVLNARLAPFLTGEREPQMQSYFMGVFGSFGFLGGRAVDRNRVEELTMVLNTEVMQGLPDTFGFANRASLFGRITGGRVIDVDIQSRDIEATMLAAQVGYGAILGAVPGSNIRPLPGLDLSQPELRLIPDERRLAEVGWTRRDLASVLRAFGDGAYVDDYFDGERTLNLILRGTEWEAPEEFLAIPVATPSGEVVSLGDLVRWERTAGPDQIRRVDRRRTVTLRVTPPPDMALEYAIDQISTQAVPAIQNMLPEDGTIAYRGTAGELDEALLNLGSSFALAVVILYLLMSALFRSFRDSLLVLWALPLATVGGVIGLRIADYFTFQPMDLLTLIGFITLLGLVVNNAILLVYQTRAAEREGLDRRDAVENAVRLRLRPILMSTLTSLFGMLPLLLIPGAGTELYRGIAAVIVGGMTVSTVFILILLPSLLRLGEEQQYRTRVAYPGGAVPNGPQSPRRDL